MAKTKIPNSAELFSQFKTDSKTGKTTEDILNTQYENLSARLGAVGAPVDDRGPVGRLLNLEQNQGMLMDIFEVIDRPGQAVKGAIVGAATGRGVMEGFVEGLAGQSDRTGLEFLEETGALSQNQIDTMGGVEKFVVNLTTDIVTDPLTYIPAGAIKRVLDKLNPFEIEQTLPKLIANVEEAANIKRQYISQTADELVAGGMDQTKAVVEAKKRAGLIETDQLDDIIKENATGLNDIRKKIDELRAKGLDDDTIYKSLSPKETELAGLDDFLKKFDQVVDDLKIAKGQYKVARRGGSAPGVEDINVYMDVDGEWFQVAGIEVKQSGKGFARGKTVKMAKGATQNVVDFGSNVKLTDESKKLIQDNYSNVMITVGTGKKARQISVAEAVTNLIEGAEKGKKGSINLFKEGMVSADDITKIEAAAREVLRNAGWDYMYIVANDGSHGFVHFADIIDNIDVKASFRASEAAQKPGKAAKEIQTRMFIDLNLKTMGTTPSAYDDIFNEVFRTVQGSGETIKVKVGFLDWAAEKNFAFSGVAKRLQQARDKFYAAFNAFFDISEDTTSQLRRMSAESQMYIHNEGTRLIAIQEEALKRNPNANVIIKELMDLDAKFVNGKVVVPVSYVNVDSALKNYLDNFLGNGQAMYLPVYGKQAHNVRNTAANAMDNINTAVRSQTGIDDAFKWIEKDGLYSLELNMLSPEEFKYLMGKPEFRSALNQTNIRMGTKSLPTEFEEFYMNNADIVDMYKKTQDDIIQTFIDELGVDNLPDFIKTSNGYARRILSDKGAEFLKASQPLARSKFLTEGVDFLKGRQYFGTDLDVNRALQVFNDLDFDFFDPNITNSLADLLRVAVTKNENGRVLNIILNGSNRKGTSLFQVIDNAKEASLGPSYTYINSFNEEFSKMYKNLSIPDQQVFNRYLTAQGFKDGKAIAIHNTAFDTLKRIEKAYVEVPELLKGYDKAVNTWKGLNLITPSFHLNSFLGNSTNMYLVGMGIADQGTYLPRSTKDLTEYNRILTTINEGIMSGLGRDDVLRNMSVGDKEVYDRLLRYFQSGASMKGRGTLDIGAVGKTLQEGGQKNLYDKLLAANFSLAENIDEVQRFALFSWAYDKEIANLKRAGGLSDMAMELKAARTAEHKVMESLFDYSHFTSFERDVMKRIIPFYTFMKNNLTFQMRNLLTNPQQYGKLGRAHKYYVSDIAGLTDEDMPDYARDNLWLPIPLNISRGDKETVTFLKANLPPGEFAELIESRGARLVSSLTVPLKLPIELALNRDIFTGQEIKEFQGQKDQMAPGTGFASFLRDEQGALAFSSDPVIQKIANDLGFRVPARYITTALGIVDSAAGYKDPKDAFAEAMNSLGLLSIREAEQVRVTNLYQALEKYRAAEKRWEQETGMNLPSKRELGLP
jgi:hypothetical protein